VGSLPDFYPEEADQGFADFLIWSDCSDFMSSALSSTVI
jgi:hypothetical protein